MSFRRIYSRKERKINWNKEKKVDTFNNLKIYSKIPKVHSYTIGKMTLNLCALAIIFLP